MGSSGWDDESRERGRPPRERRGEDDRPPGRAYERGGSAHASSYDQPSRGSSRGWDDGGSGGRPPGHDDLNPAPPSPAGGRLPRSVGDKAETQSPKDIVCGTLLGKNKESDLVCT